MTKSKKGVEKKPKQLTLFFASKEDCQNACERLGFSLRKVTDIDRSHNGNYSKYTGHYALVYKNGNTHMSNIRAKMIIDEDVYDALSDDVRDSLKAVEVTSKGWVAP